MTHTLLSVTLFSLGALLLAFARRKERLLLGFYFQWVALAVELFQRSGGYSVIVTLFLGLFLSVSSFIFQNSVQNEKGTFSRWGTVAFASIGVTLTLFLVWNIGRPFLTGSELSVASSSPSLSAKAAAGSLLLDRYPLNLILFALMLFVSCIASMGLKHVSLKERRAHGSHK